MNDPLTRWRNCLLLTMFGGAVVMLMCATWSIQPLSATGISNPLSIDVHVPTASDNNNTPTPEESPPPYLEFDSNVFAVTLWHTPPPEVPRESPVLAEKPQKVEPLKLQLVAIIEENGVRRAALYDQIDDRIVIIADGGTIRDRAVRVSDKAVEFSTSDSRENERLLLRPDENTRDKHIVSGNTQS